MVICVSEPKGSTTTTSASDAIGIKMEVFGSDAVGGGLGRCLGQRQQHAIRGAEAFRCRVSLDEIHRGEPMKPATKALAGRS